MVRAQNPLFRLQIPPVELFRFGVVAPVAIKDANGVEHKLREWIVFAEEVFSRFQNAFRYPLGFHVFPLSLICT